LTVLKLKIKKKDGKNNFYKLKLKNWKKKSKRINYFHEIHAKKVRSKMGNTKKGPQQNRPRQSGHAKKMCF